MGGRIRKEDVLAATPVAGRTRAGSRDGPLPPRRLRHAQPATPRQRPSPLRGTTVKMTRIRKITAEKMLESLHGMAQLTSVVEVDCSRIWTLRAKARASFEAKQGAKLTFLPFFTKAVADALVEHPFLNASVDGDSIVYHREVNLSLAVDTEKGLMLPTLARRGRQVARRARPRIADLADSCPHGRPQGRRDQRRHVLGDQHRFGRHAARHPDRALASGGHPRHHDHREARGRQQGRQRRGRPVHQAHVLPASQLRPPHRGWGRRRPLPADRQGPHRGRRTSRPSSASSPCASSSRVRRG